MKKNFKIYIVCWATLLAVFNTICFVTKSETTGINNLGGTFWVGYAVITFAIIGQLACAYFAFKEKNLKKLFYKLPLIRISYTGLICTIVLGAICMAIPKIPYWVGIIVCLPVLAINVISVIKAKVAADIVANVDEKVNAKTQFIKLATLNAQNIMNRAKGEVAKAECKKVYEALRYADPMSNDALVEVESQITLKFDEFSNAVTCGEENIGTLAEEIVALVRDRNNKCRLLK